METEYPELLQHCIDVVVAAPPDTATLYVRDNGIRAVTRTTGIAIYDYASVLYPESVWVSVPMNVMLNLKEFM